MLKCYPYLIISMKGQKFEKTPQSSDFKYFDVLKGLEYTKETSFARGTRLFARNPVAWTVVIGWLAEKLAGGVISAVGAKIWNKMSGEWDLKDVHNEVIKSFEKLLRQAFEQSKFDEAMTFVKIAQTRMIDYNSSPTNEDLNRALDNSYEGLIRLMDLKDYGGFGNFMIAAALHLAILQEQAKQNPSKKEVIKKWVIGPREDKRSFNVYLDNAKSYFLDKVIPRRFSGVTVDEHIHRSQGPEPHDFTRPMIVDKVIYTSYYEFDGQVIEIDEREVPDVDWRLKDQLKRDAERAREEHIRRVKKDFEQKVMKPCYDAHKLMKKSWIFE